jgi:hypothetical protein
MSYLKQAPLLGCLCIATQASATDIVLYREGLVSELAPRIQRMDAVAENPKFQRFDDLLQQHKASLSRGLMSRCLLSPEELESDDLAQRLKRGRVAVQYEDFEPANEHLAKAEQLFRCASTIVDPQVGAQLYLLYGIVAFHQGDERTSRDRFERAFLFQEALDWDSGNPIDSKPIFEEARWSIYERAPSRLYVEPDYGSPLFINGRAPEKSDDFYLIPSGQHLLQVGDGKHTYSISLESGEVTLSPPIIAQPDIFHAVDDPARVELLYTVLEQLFPERTTLFLVDNEQVWQHIVGERGFTDQWKTVVTTDSQRKKRTITAWALVGSGAVVAVGSTTMMVAGLSRANEANVAMENAKSAARASTDASEIMQFNKEYESAYKEYGQAYVMNLIGAVSAVGGGMLAGGGLTLLATSSSRVDADGALLQLRINLPQRGLR